MKNKVFLALASGLLLLGAGCGATTTAPTSDTSAVAGAATVYTNAALGFSLQKPSAWRVEDIPTIPDYTGRAVLFYYPGADEELALRVARIESPHAAVIAKQKVLFKKNLVGESLETVQGEPAQKLCFDSFSGTYCEYYIAVGNTTLNISDFTTISETHRGEGIGVYQTVALIK